MNESAAAGKPPTQRMMELIVGSWAERAVYAAAALDLPERLCAGDTDLTALAAATGAHQGALRRLMDYLVALGVCAGNAADGYRNTPLGEVLRPGVPGSVRDYALLAGQEFHRAWGEILHTLRTGEPAFDRAFGEDLYTYLGRSPEAAHRFNQAMNAGQVLFEQVPQLHDFTGADRIVDIGGGNGELLAEVLRRSATTRAVLLEQGPALADAAEFLAGHGPGIADRCEIVDGDMFRAVPEGADVYVLARVLVNWDDERAGHLLRNCAAAMRPDSTLLLVERPQAEGPPMPVPSAVDLLMMTVTSGGRSRTLAEYEGLLERAGLVLGAHRQLPQGYRLLSATRR
ncbi:methyltransferase [Streptomyces sp. NPDC057555]|uniref:methyltransferase n=1 Tax=Streptomyces sp. NPDC057555 TaxID=3346166 RepID=UPI0036AC5E44